MKGLLSLSNDKSGFTLIELILVITITGIIISFVTINFVATQSKDLINSTVSILVADLKEQQIKAISGDTEGTPAPSELGIFIEPNSYTLFRGATYSPSDPSNFVINIEPPLSFSNNLPSSQIIFAINSGEWESYISGQNSITIQSAAGGQKIITINRYGAVTIN